jgi:hypothetical protein
MYGLRSGELGTPIATRISADEYANAYDDHRTNRWVLHSRPVLRDDRSPAQSGIEDEKRVALTQAWIRGTL